MNTTLIAGLTSLAAVGIAADLLVTSPLASLAEPDGSVPFRCAEAQNEGRDGCWIRDGKEDPKATVPTCRTEYDPSLDLTREACIATPVGSITLTLGRYQPLTTAMTIWGQPDGRIALQTSANGQDWQPWLSLTPATSKQKGPAVWAKYVRVVPDAAAPGAPPRQTFLVVRDGQVIQPDGTARAALNNGDPDQVASNWRGTIASLAELHLSFETRLTAGGQSGPRLFALVMGLLAALVGAAAVGVRRAYRLGRIGSLVGSAADVAAAAAALLTLVTVPIMGLAVAMGVVGLLLVGPAYLTAGSAAVIGAVGTVLAGAARRTKSAAIAATATVASVGMLVLLHQHTGGQRRVPAAEFAATASIVGADASPVDVVAAAVTALTQSEEKLRIKACTLLDPRSRNSCFPEQLHATTTPQLVWGAGDAAVVRYGTEPANAGSLVLLSRRAGGWKLTRLPTPEGDTCLATRVERGQAPDTCG